MQQSQIRGHTVHWRENKLLLQVNDVAAGVVFSVFSTSLCWEYYSMIHTLRYWEASTLFGIFPSDFRMV